MSYAPKLILLAPAPDTPLLGWFVEDCIRDGVRLICIYGENCEEVEDALDWLLIEKD